MGWLKLKENDDALAATDTGVKPGVELTPPDAVLTHVTPHVTSKVSDGLVVEAPTIRTTTLTLVDSGLATIAVQL
jgi:hypothetical protein